VTTVKQVATENQDSSLLKQVPHCMTHVNMLLFKIVRPAHRIGCFTADYPICLQYAHILRHFLDLSKKTKRKLLYYKAKPVMKS